jgi:hypothetical protein
MTYYDKYLKYKYKYLKLNKMIGGGQYYLQTLNENITSTISLNTLLIGNTTHNMLQLPSTLSRELILTAKDRNSGGKNRKIIDGTIVSTPIACDFYEDFREEEEINLDPFNFFIFIHSNNDNILGYLNFTFIINDTNIYRFNTEITARPYMSVYINNRCSFSYVKKNEELFKSIRDTYPTYSVGNHLWSSLLVFLNKMRKDIIASGKPDFLFFIFNNSTSEAEEYHIKNGMNPITDELNRLIMNTVALNMYTLNDIDDYNNLFYVIK